MAKELSMKSLSYFVVNCRAEAIRIHTGVRSHDIVHACTQLLLRP